MQVLKKNQRALYVGITGFALFAVIAVTVVTHMSAQASDMRVTLSGHTVPALKGQSPAPTTTQAAANKTLQIDVTLNWRHAGEMKTLFAAQNNVASPLYHKYLTTQQFMARFSPTLDQVNTVQQFLTSYNLKVLSVSTTRQVIKVSGTVSDIQRAFAVTIANYTYHGRGIYAPENDPSVPTNLSGIVQSITGLDNFAQAHHLGSQSSQQLLGSTGAYSPTQLRSAYDITPLTNAGYNGTKQSIAIFELDNYNERDVATYRSNYGLSALGYTNVAVDGGTTDTTNGAIEVELDMEVVSAIAPAATQYIYIGNPNDDFGTEMIDVFNQIFADHHAPVVSMSWGYCEAGFAPSTINSLDSTFYQGAIEGISVLAASGDAGAYDCGDTSLGVDIPASDPYVIGVGGTTLALNGSGGYGSESVWSCPSPTCGDRGPEGDGSGGGASSVFSKPFYQTGNGVPADGARDVPDVAADADPNTGYEIYCTTAECGGLGFLSVGGTSGAAPLWAAMITDTNQYILGTRSPAYLGWANASLYRLFNTPEPYAPYHDITSGNNLYYNATAGYDRATGIGTPDAWNFARDAARGEFDGVGVYVPASAAFYLTKQLAGGPASTALNFGPVGCQPVTGDWTGKGYDSIGAYCNGTFYLRNSNTPGFADIAFTYGPTSGCQAVVGDWTGKGYDSIGVYCNGTFYLRNSNAPGFADIAFTYGPTSGCQAVVGDWNAQLTETIGVHCGNIYYLRTSNSGGPATYALAYGLSGVPAVEGDWAHTALTGNGIYVPGTATFYLRVDPTTSGFADYAFPFGPANAVPLAGFWGA